MLQSEHLLRTVTTYSCHLAVSLFLFWHLLLIHSSSWCPFVAPWSLCLQINRVFSRISSRRKDTLSASVYPLIFIFVILQSPGGAAPSQWTEESGRKEINSQRNLSIQCHWKVARWSSAEEWGGGAEDVPKSSSWTSDPIVKAIVRTHHLITKTFGF